MTTLQGYVVGIVIVGLVMWLDAILTQRQTRQQRPFEDWSAFRRWAE